MNTRGSITRWIAEVRTGDERALGELFDRYWPYLVRLAQKKLRHVPARVAEAEDVAQEAFWGFLRSLRAGLLPRLVDRSDLMALWTVITARRAASAIERQNRLKRGGGLLRGESALSFLASSRSGAPGIERVEGREPSPDERAILADCYERYIGGLPEQLRGVAEMHLAGLTHQEIADRSGCSLRSIERKVPLLVRRWQELGTEALEEDG